MVEVCAKGKSMEALMHDLLQAGAAKEAGGLGSVMPRSPTACMGAEDVLMHQKRVWQAQGEP